MNYIKLYNLKPGDRIVSPKSSLKIIQHHAIYLGKNFDEQDLIAENEFGKFVRIVVADEFFASYPEVTNVVRFVGSGRDRENAIKRALDQVGKPYDLIDFNCEHFANFVQFTHIKSDQVAFALFLCLVLIATIILVD